MKALVHVAWGFVAEQVNVAKVSKRRVGGRVVKVVDEATTEVVVKWPRNWKELAATFMEGLVVAREKLEIEEIESVEVVEDQRRRRRLVKFYVAFELLAAALGYRRRCNKKWAYAGRATAP